MLPSDLVNMSIPSDHAGFEYKEKLKELLEASGNKVKDYGTFSTEPVDYPGYIWPGRAACCDRPVRVGNRRWRFGERRSHGRQPAEGNSLCRLLECRIGVIGPPTQ
jgi:hypothetical protein